MRWKRSNSACASASDLPFTASVMSEADAFEIAQPVMERFGVPATARASLALYNTRAEVDALVQGLHKVREMFA